MPDISIKHEPVDDARLCSVTAAELEICVDTDIKIEQSDDDEPYLKHCKQETVDSVIQDVIDETLHDADVGMLLDYDIFGFYLFYHSHPRRRSADLSTVHSFTSTWVGVSVQISCKSSRMLDVGHHTVTDTPCWTDILSKYIILEINASIK